MKNRFINKQFSILCIATFCIFTNANALVKEVELPLFAYHIDNNATFKAAPNKLDANAVFVANPGILLGLDSRKDAKTDGLSFLAKGGFLQDCANKTLFALGGGGRYRHHIAKRVSVDLNGYLMGANAVTKFGNDSVCYDPLTGDYTNCQTIESNNDERAFAFLPLANIGFNYHLKSGKILGFTVSYVPPEAAIAATSGGKGLLFFTANMGF